MGTAVSEPKAIILKNELPAATVSAVAVRAQLDRILASPNFAHSERPGRFLRFLVEQTLSGQAQELSEHRLAVDVFHRRDSFNRDGDPIVRVEAGRLRSRLRRYYENEGRNDEVLIEVPARTYVPAFRRRRPGSRGTSRRWPVFGRAWKGAALGLAALAVAALVMYGISRRSPGPAAPATPLAVAVLPFSDLSPGKDQEYFCNGLTEEIVAWLTKAKGLRVISWTTAFNLKGKAEDTRTLAAQLHAGVVLTGSVRRMENRLRIVAELVNADGYNLWSETYDRQIEDVFAIQQEIAVGIVNALRSEVAGARWLRPVERYTPNLKAYDLYLQGLFFARKPAGDGLAKAIAHLERAIQADPGYADAYAQLAQSYCLLGESAGLPPRMVMAKSRAAAEKALTLDSTLADAHAALALVRALYDWDWAAAEQEFQRAHELNPGDASLHEARAVGLLMPTGRLDEALRAMQEADALDPVSPRIDTGLAMICYFQRRYDQAIEELREPIELDPQFSPAYLVLASVYEQKSMFKEAQAAAGAAENADRSGAAKAVLGRSYALRGDRAKAKELLAELLRLSKQSYISPVHIALLYLGLGDNGAAMDWLEKASREHSATLAGLKVDPRFDSLRREPRFRALLHTMHFE